MAITTEEVIGAGGLVLPGDYVDILVVYDILFPSDPKDPASLEEAEAYFVHTVLQNIEVLAVSQTIVDLVPEVTNVPGGQPNPPASTVNGQRIRNSEANPEPKAITVTLALTPEQAQKLYIAEANGKVRLIVRPFGDAEERPIDPMIESDLFPRNLPNPFMR
jgi:Flp pilus assembly protein CpaB